MTRIHLSYYKPKHDTKHPINMINHILITLQVEIIISRHKSSYSIIIFKNHYMLSSYNFYIIKIKTCTAGVHHHVHMFIMIFSTKFIDLAYISWLHIIHFIIASFILKSNMNHYKLSTWNIIYIYISIQPDYYQEHIHIISWFKPHLNIQRLS